MYGQTVDSDIDVLYNLCRLSKGRKGTWVRKVSKYNRFHCLICGKLPVGLSHFHFFRSKVYA